MKTVRQIVRDTGYSLSHVQHECRKGHLRAVKVGVGKRTRYEISEADYMTWKTMAIDPRGSTGKRPIKRRK